MKHAHGRTVAVLGLAAALSLLCAQGGPGAAVAHSVPVQPGDVVRVNVRFNSHAPLADTGERALAEARQARTRLLYRLAGGECAILRETLASTCRLTGLTVSAQVREPSKRAPLRLYLNGNAQYAITLQEERAN